jgi:hypothetical protein
MKSFYRWAVALSVSVLIGGLLGGYLTWRLTAPKDVRPEISSEVILQALTSQGFLVTQSIISDQKVTIDRQSGNVFRDFFLGQTITARGTMEANLGIDLTELSSEDVLVSDEKILVRIPDVRLFNTRLIGDVEVENAQGIIKRLFQPDDGYNESLRALTAATESLASSERVMANARERSREELARLVKLLRTDAREVVIEIKN